MTLAPDANHFSIDHNTLAYPHYMMVSFDAVATAPDLAIDRIGVMVPAGFNNGNVLASTSVVEPGTTFTVNPFSLATVSPFIYSVDPLPIASMNVENFGGNTSGLPYEESVIINPRKRVTIHTIVTVGTESDAYGGFGVYFGGLTHEFRLVQIPEPSTLSVVLLTAICMILRRPA